jgi:hypothetical protein
VPEAPDAVARKAGYEIGVDRVETALITAGI